MTATVVIATRNRRDSLLHTLERLEALPERPPVVVVDNGSDDGTSHAVRLRHPDVRVIEPGANLGAAARTVAAREATTPYLAFCDDDSWWEPGAIGRATELLRGDSRLGLVAARIVVEPDGRLDPTCEQMRDSPLRADPTLPGPEVLGFVACGAVVRRDAFLASGGFEPRFRVGGEESLLSIDMAAGGWRLVYADEVVAHHAPGGHRPGRTRTQLRNALWTAWLRRPLPRALALTARVPATAGPGGAAALADALRGLPWAMRRRRVVPRELERALRAVERP